jgi:hypothetical protein
MDEVKRCPRCQSDAVLPIVYGLPSPAMVEASAAGQVALGGCMVTPESPDWQCEVCDHEWRGVEVKH